MRKSLEQRLNVVEDLIYVVKNRRMAKRIQSGDAVTPEVIRKRVDGMLRHPGLTREQERQAREYWYPYKVSTISQRECLALTGNFYPDYMPGELYYAYLDPWLNDRKKAVGLENKCLFTRLFPGIRQPEAVAYRINGFWLSPEYASMTREEVTASAERCGDVFVKQAEDSCGGRGVIRVRTGENFAARLDNALREMRGDVLLQKPLRQHPELARFNPASVNTCRIMTLLSENGVEVLSSFFRSGVGDTLVDNYNSGGLICGIDGEGRLKRYAYSRTGRFEAHPVSGIRFEGCALPSFAGAVEMVKRAHPMLPSFRLISWDIAVDEAGEPVLIEANLIEGGFHSHQITNGPLFKNHRALVDEALRDSDYPRYSQDEKQRVKLTKGKAGKDHHA